MTRSLLALVLAIAACGQADDGPPFLPDDADTPAACDGAACADAAAPPPDAIACLDQCTVDAMPGLPINASCEPTRDQCASGLTCRIQGAHEGLCRPAGILPAGALCTAADQCGPNMGCIPAEPGRLRCYVVCEVAAPLVRCNQVQACTPFWGADTGVCT